MKRLFNKSFLIYTSIILLSQTVLLGEELYATNLFDAKRGVVEQEKKVKPAAKIKKPKVSRVNYKLIAISKLAHKYNLTFENVRKRDKVHTRWSKSDPSTESLIADFYIHDVVERRVLFKAMNDKKFRCHESKKEQVSCDPKNKIVAYELVTNKPTKSKARPNRAKKPNTNKSLQKNKNKQAKNTKQPFQAKRIEQKDVPDDMRLIKTPFGDRLVPK